jgi:hypothetical protein
VIEPHRRLGRHVLAAAVREATDPRARPARRAEARAFLDSADARWWCEVAGLDVGRLRAALGGPDGGTGA